MADYKTPGVYIVEKNAFPSSAVAVETAIPVFIGYTERAERNGKSLNCVPTRISSMAEYFELFGGPFTPRFDITDIPKVGDGATPPNQVPDPSFYTKENTFKLNGADNFVAYTSNYELYFYSCLRLFYLNGGSDCYIMSVGKYTDVIAKGIETKRFTGDPTATPPYPKVFDILEKEYEPTLVLMPDVVALHSKVDPAIIPPYYDLYTAVLEHCNKTQSRFGIFDVARSVDGTNTPNVNTFREKIGSNFLKYGAAYYPWLRTTVIDASEVDFRNITNYSVVLNNLIPNTEVQAKQLTQKGPGDVKQVTQAEFELIPPKPADLAAYNAQKVKPITQAEFDAIPAKPANLAAYNKQPGIKQITQAEFDAIPAKPATLAAYNALPIKQVTQAEFDAISPKAKDVETYNAAIRQNVTNYHQSLIACSPTYKKIMDELRSRLNLLPPSAAMAGIYTLVDTARGVWKAPANVSVASTNAPEVNISNDDQKTLNVDPVSGKSINIIRAFPGIGTLVWGARTLDGNSQDWRYINVRRTLIMIEQSLKLATRNYVFEPNDSGTWVTIQSMMNNFLHNLWKQGALAGAVPEQAYSVQIGLGITMTPNDILDGLLKVTVLLAIVKPAEFIELTFQQQQQQS